MEKSEYGGKERGEESIIKQGKEGGKRKGEEREGRKSKREKLKTYSRQWNKHFQWEDRQQEDR